MADTAKTEGTALKVHHLRPAPGAKTPKTRVGRGEGSKGKTAGRGTKGTKARYQVPESFEGGQMPLHMRMPKLRGAQLGAPWFLLRNQLSVKIELPPPVNSFGSARRAAMILSSPLRRNFSSTKLRKRSETITSRPSRTMYTMRASG